MDTHALSKPAFASAVEVLAANGVETMIDEHGGYTPTPVISHAILSHNRGRESGLADGVVISPSHNPPDDGGFKYNPASGGPAGVDVTRWIEKTANELLVRTFDRVPRIPYERARKATCIHDHARQRLRACGAGQRSERPAETGAARNEGEPFHKPPAANRKPWRKGRDVIHGNSKEGGLPGRDTQDGRLTLSLILAHRGENFPPGSIDAHFDGLRRCVEHFRRFLVGEPAYRR